MSEFLVKPGAIVSTAGVGMFITFVLLLVIFPVVKVCEEGNNNCTYTSGAPPPLNIIVQPAYLAVSLLLIAAGVLMVRFGRRRESKKPASGG